MSIIIFIKFKKEKKHEYKDMKKLKITNLIVDMKEDFLLFSAPEVTPLTSLSVDLFSKVKPLLSSCLSRLFCSPPVGESASFPPYIFDIFLVD